MKFFAIAATLIAAVSAGYAADECSVVTVTETVTAPAGHVPTAPGSVLPSIAPYPTASAPYPTGPAGGAAPSGTGAVVPSGTGAAVPTGTGSYTTPPSSEYTGAASNLQVGSFVAGVGAIAALFL